MATYWKVCFFINLGLTVFFAVRGDSYFPWSVLMTAICGGMVKLHELEDHLER